LVVPESSVDGLQDVTFTDNYEVTNICSFAPDEPIEIHSYKPTKQTLIELEKKLKLRKNTRLSPWPLVDPTKDFKFFVYPELDTLDFDDPICKLITLAFCEAKKKFFDAPDESKEEFVF